jgi:hypothetical protein
MSGFYHFFYQKTSENEISFHIYRRRFFMQFEKIKIYLRKWGKKLCADAAKYVLTVCAVSFAVLFSIAPFSCRAGEEGIEILSGDYEAPQIIKFGAVSSSELSLVCTKPVTVGELAVRRADEQSSESSAQSTEEGMQSTGTVQDSLFSASASYDAAGTGVMIILSPATETGAKYTVSGVAKDTNGNTLTFSLPFTGWNDNPPVMVMNEIRSEGTKEKPEFVELYVVRGGNTAGLVLESAYDGDEKKYSFPIMKVATGEYITVHFRTVEGAPCADETGNDLALSDSLDTVPSTVINTKSVAETVAAQKDARDLWIQNTAARIPPSDVLLLTNSADGRILDAVLFAESTKGSWSSAQTAAAEKAVLSGIWTGTSLPSGGADSTYATTTRTLCRQNLAAVAAAYERQTAGASSAVSENTSGAGMSVNPLAVIPFNASGPGDWAVVDTSCATPGFVNSTKIYAPK